MANGDGITIPKILLGGIIPAGFAVLGWFLSQLYVMVDRLDDQVQDIDRTQEAVTTRQSVFAARIEQEQISCAEYRKNIEERLDRLRLEIDRKADKTQASDRYTGRQARDDAAHLSELWKKQEEINSITHDTLWIAIHNIENKVDALHDWLFKKQ